MCTCEHSSDLQLVLGK
uniref:Uncharacterized protein n=1 Tax=Rhizophora mucronata TaxID=61149 RepID=A0A2P2PEH2_RHIMU